jgi:signal transduction histidine kinase
MTQSDPGEREAARERQSHVRHELRSPLAAMYPALSMLLDGIAGELTTMQRDYLEIIERSAVRLERYLSGATESGWLDCAAAPVEPAAVSLAEAVEDTLALRRIGGLEGPRIEIERARGAQAVAWADREDVRHIVADLLDNAVRYAGDRGPVRALVSASVTEPAVSLAVHDDGDGIPSDEIARVFDFGFRGHAAREASVPGLGIGLWVCRELAERNGGSIAVRSEVGAGTTVTLTLPAAPAR